MLIAKIKSYDKNKQTKPLFFHIKTKSDSSVGCNCGNKTLRKRVTLVLSCTIEISDAYITTVLEARLLLGVFKIKPTKYIQTVPL